MFDKLKQINKLRQMQNEIASEKFVLEKDGVRVVVNGSMLIEELSLSGDAAQIDGNKIKNCINDAMKKAQYAVAQKMSSLMGQ